MSFSFHRPCSWTSVFWWKLWVKLNLVWIWSINPFHHDVKRDSRWHCCLWSLILCHRGCVTVVGHQAGLRQLVSWDLDTEWAEFVQFYLRMGGDGAECNQGDSREEGLLLQYSNDGGISWGLIAEMYFTDFTKPRWEHRRTTQSIMLCFLYIFTLHMRNSRIKLHVIHPNNSFSLYFFAWSHLKVNELALRRAQPQLFNATQLAIENAYLN